MSLQEEDVQPERAKPFLSDFVEQYVDGPLADVYFGNTLLAWVVALATMLVVATALFVLRALLRGRLGRLLSRLPGRFDDVVVQTVAGAHGWFVFVVALYAGTRALQLPEDAEFALRALTVVVVLLQIGLWAHRAASRSLEVWTTSTPNPPSATAVAALSFLTGLVIWSVVLLLALQNLGIEIGALLAGMGVGGIAAALALQTVFKDLFASLSIFTDRPFDIGDFIIVGDYKGTVNKVGLRSTRIGSLSGEQIILPNGELVESRIRNYKRMQRRRIETVIGVVYGTPHDVVARIPGMIRAAIEGVEGLTFDRAHFKGFGESSLDFEFVYIVETAEFNGYMDRRQAVNLDLMRRFEAEGIEFAFPTRTVHLQRGERLVEREEPK